MTRRFRCGLRKDGRSRAGKACLHVGGSPGNRTGAECGCPPPWTPFLSSAPPAGKHQPSRLGVLAPRLKATPPGAREGLPGGLTVPRWTKEPEFRIRGGGTRRGRELGGACVCRLLGARTCSLQACQADAVVIPISQLSTLRLQEAAWVSTGPELLPGLCPSGACSGVWGSGRRVKD